MLSSTRELRNGGINKHSTVERLKEEAGDVQNKHKQVRVTNRHINTDVQQLSKLRTGGTF